MTTNKWTDVGAVSQILSDTDIDSIANNSYVLSAEIDPGAVSLDQYVTYRQRLKSGSAITAGTLAVKCWYVLDVGDGGSYSDESASVAPVRAPDFVFFAVTGSTTQQIMQSVPAVVVRPAHPHKILWQNTSGVTTSAGATENQLHASTFNDSQA